MPKPMAREVQALKAWALVCLPLAGRRATAATLAKAAGVSRDRMSWALRSLVQDGLASPSMQTHEEAGYGVRRAVVYALVVRA